MLKKINQRRYEIEQEKKESEARTRQIGEKKAQMVFKNIEKIITKVVSRLQKHPERYRQLIINEGIKYDCIYYYGCRPKVFLYKFPDPDIHTVSFFNSTYHHDNKIYQIPNYKQKIEQLLDPYQTVIKNLFPDCILSVNGRDLYLTIEISTNNDLDLISTNPPVSVSDSPDTTNVGSVVPQQSVLAVLGRAAPRLGRTPCR